VLVWDNLNVHLTYGIRQFIDRQDWLTVYQLPSYAPDLNPVEGIWSLLRRGSHSKARCRCLVTLLRPKAPPPATSPPVRAPPRRRSPAPG
jgi:transposase